MFKYAILLALFSAIAAHAADLNVLAFSGSTREDSSNSKLLNEAVETARKQGAKVTVIDLADYAMPFYNADWEKKNHLPPKAKELRALMMKSQVIMIASPEYNSSVSAILKNALDWASRNDSGEGSRDAFRDKKFLIMSASPGKGGGARGLVHLKQIIENVGGTVVPQQISLPDSYNAFDAQGHLKNPETKAQLDNAVSAALSTR